MRLLIKTSDTEEYIDIIDDIDEAVAEAAQIAAEETHPGFYGQEFYSGVGHAVVIDAVGVLYRVTVIKSAREPVTIKDAKPTYAERIRQQNNTNTNEEDLVDDHISRIPWEAKKND